MLIAQISDLHISKFGNKTLGLAPMSENLLQCVDHINQFIPLPDLVLVTGDISNSGLTEELEHAKKLLDQLSPPYFVIPGNHDNRVNFFQVFGEPRCQANANGLIQYVIDDFDMQLIALDTSVPNAPGGEFSSVSNDWLNEQLLHCNDKATLIFMHHPPVNMGIAETNIDGFIGKELLADTVQKHANIEAILCGHIHLSAHTRWHGTLISTAPSIGMKLVIDFSMQQESQFIVNEASYQLHYWTKDKNLITIDINANDKAQGHLFHPTSNAMH